MTIHESTPSHPHLSGHHKRTFEAIFQHPTSHNLAWQDVRSLLAILADVEEKHNGLLNVSRNGKQITIHPPKHKDVASTDEVLAIRRFLQESSDSPVVATVEQGSDLLVVIDHHEARIYRSESPGSIPEKLVPYDPHGYGKHLRAKVPETSGRREPESKSFYEAVATTLRGAERILIFGTGTGESNAMDHLVTYLRHDHADLANHVVGTVVIDENHTTEGQILAKAREFLGQK